MHALWSKASFRYESPDGSGSGRSQADFRVDAVLPGILHLFQGTDMTSDTWYYTRGQERVGPVGFAQLQALVQSRHVSESDMVWNEGMPQWQRVGDVADLGGSAPLAAAQAAAPDAAPVGYYTNVQGLPPRATVNLRGHAPPQGDIGDWPVDDLRVEQFRETARLRKKVMAAANLYRALL